MKKLIYILLAFIIVSCSRNKEDIQNKYSFFIAGHIYGNPSGDNLGVHPPFKDDFPQILSDKNIRFGVLTGDLVRNSTEENWAHVIEDLDELGLPYHVVPGNHDTYNRKLYATLFADSTDVNRVYYSFEYNNDLFIILDGNLDRWNITGDQLDFLKQVLKDKTQSCRNIFVFVHQLIWWDEDNIFRSVNLNWPPYTPDTTNYWNEIEPLLRSTGKKVYLMAGDLGANYIASPLMYYNDGKLTYIASGMGNMTNDNYINVEIDEKGNVRFELIALQGERHRLGELEDYQLTE